MHYDASAAVVLRLGMWFSGDRKHLGEPSLIRMLKEIEGLSSSGGGQLPDCRPIHFANNDGGEFLFPRLPATQVLTLMPLIARREHAATL